MPKVFSLPIFTKEFRRSIPSVILWFLISGGLLVLALYSFSAAAQTDFSDRLQETLSAFPEELLAEFQLDNLPELSEFLTYFALTSHCVFAVGCLFACYRGCRSMVKLESHQSIVLIYAQPISRGSILISSFASQALALLIYNLGLWGVSYGMAALQPDFDAASFALACLFSCLVWLCLSPNDIFLIKEPFQGSPKNLKNSLTCAGVSRMAFSLYPV